MKHKVAVAELNGWTFALQDAMQKELISPEIASFISAISGDHVRGLLAGAVVHGHTLDEFTADGEMFDEVLAEINAETQGYPNA
jgi:hypothetical protein